MPMAKLDHAFCLTAQCEPGKRKTDYYDPIIKGLVQEVRPAGSTFYLRFQDTYGRQRQHKIANLGDLSIDKIRKEATRLRAIVALGCDPLAEKRQKRSVITYAELAVKHLDYATSYQKSPANTERIIRLHLLAPWAKRRLDEINQPAVAKWLGDLRTSGLAPATVEKIRVIFNRSFELALRWDLPGVTKNPVKGIPRKPINNARTRYLSPAETKRLVVAVEASSNPQLKYIVGLLLLTGARVSELLHSEWRHIDLDRQVWLIPTSKTGKARHVPLSGQAIELLAAVPRFDGCPYVLPNPDSRLPYVSVKRVWQTARKAAVLHDLRIHDLRHSAASFMINAGIDLFAVGRVLGHADHKSTMRYSHLANDTLLAAVEAGAAKMNVDWS